MEMIVRFVDGRKPDYLRPHASLWMVTLCVLKQVTDSLFRLTFLIGLACDLARYLSYVTADVAP